MVHRNVGQSLIQSSLGWALSVTVSNPWDIYECQDASGIFDLSSGDEKYQLLAVADGHGSENHSRSRIGSVLAVRAALTAFSNFFNSRSELSSTFDIKNSFKTCLRTTIREWRELIKADAGSLKWNSNPISPSYDLGILYGTTLLLCLVTKNHFVCGMLGDGIILAKKDSEIVVVLGDNESKIGSETTSLCSINSSDLWKVRLVPKNIGYNAILLATDGLDDSFPISITPMLEYCFEWFNVGITTNGVGLLGSLPSQMKSITETGSGDDISVVLHGQNTLK